MILQEHKREVSFKKAQRKDYSVAKRIREMEMGFEKAMKADDVYHMNYFDRQISKLYKSLGLGE